MNALSRTVPIFLAALAAACDQGTEGKPPVTPPPVPARTSTAPVVPPTTPPLGAGTKAPPPTKRVMPKFPPLTEELARRVLRSQLDRLGGDDPSRQALLYLADLGDRSAISAIHEKLLAQKDGKYEDLAAASVGAEASLAYAEPGAAATVLAVAKQYVTDEEDPDEYLIHALGRVDGPERAAATSALLKIVEGKLTEGDDEVARLAVELLAKNGASEARDLFVKIAGEAELDGQIRASAVAGLLHLKDPKGRELAEKLIAELMKDDGSVDAADVIAGFGIEGAVEADEFVKTALDRSIAAEDAAAIFHASAAASAIARIHVAGGGAELVPWLRELATKSEGEHEDDAAFALWAVGDEASAPAVAKTLEDTVAAWSEATDMDPAIEIIDIAARRGTAAKPPLRPIVDSAAQVDPAKGGKGFNDSIVELNLAAAHAFLKSGGK